MEGGDTNAASETDVWWKMNEEDVQGDGGDHVSNAYEHGSIVDLIAFLKLMVRMRRVILQDSVMFMEERGPEGVTMMNKLLASDQMQQIFIQNDFLQFKKDLLDDIKRHKEERTRIKINEELNNTVIADAVNGMSNETSESLARQERLLKEILVSVQQSQHHQAELEHQQYLALGNQFGMWQNLHMQQLQQGHQMQLQLRQFEQKQRYRMEGTRLAENVPPPLRHQHDIQWRVQRAIQQPDQQQQQDRQQDQQQPQQQGRQLGQQQDQQQGQQLDQQQDQQQSQQQSQQQQEFQEEEEDENDEPLTAFGRRLKDVPPVPPQFKQPCWKVDYTLVPDRGALTVKHACWEYYGPMAALKLRRPYDRSERKAVERRRRLIQGIEADAKANSLSFEEARDSLSVSNQSKTVSSLANRLQLLYPEILGNQTHYENDEQ